MSKIVIGTRTLTRDPQTMTLLEADKICASVLTYSSVAFFSWGTSIIGKEVLLEWPKMTTDEYVALQVICAADVPVVFTPSDGGGHTYNVEMTSLTGKYFIGRGLDSASSRRDVKMTLLILSVAS